MAYKIAEYLTPEAKDAILKQRYPAQGYNQIRRAPNGCCPLSIGIRKMGKRIQPNPTQITVADKLSPHDRGIGLNWHLIERAASEFIRDWDGEGDRCITDLAAALGVGHE